jgi:formiminotetrahydrofolate cyclodeaminase
MVARYTTGTKYAEHEALVERTTKVADELSSEALRLADSDEQVFQAVIDAYRLPSDTGELKAAKTSAIQAALVQAAQTPAQLVKLAGAVVDLADGLADVANPNVISDVAAAADAARAAATTARVNIDINVVAIKDQAVRSLLKEQTDGIEEKVVAAADALVARVRERILQ